MIVKAQLRVRVRPPQHPVAQELADHLVAAYEERLGLICDEIHEVLSSVDHRRERAAQLLLIVPPRQQALQEAIVKASHNQVYAPGARGGKWYRDGQGHIRYGEPPQTSGRAPAGAKKPTKVSGGEVAGHIGHYRPGAFAGATGVDRDLTDYLLDGTSHGFRPGELRFLGSWYGTNNHSGALFDAFLDCTGLTREDLKGDLSSLRFGSQELTYEEAVFEFFAAQENLFMGEDEQAEGEDWDTVLNDQIKPALDSVLGKYETLKQDPEFHEKVVESASRRVRTFFSNARKNDTSQVANHITGNPDPRQLVEEVLGGLVSLGLFRHQPHANAAHHARGKGHLSGHPTLDERLLVDDPKRNPLLAARDRFDELSASQLMLTYIAAEMCRRWDPETKTYSDEDHTDKGHAALGQALMDALSRKHESWSGALDLVQKDLGRAINHVVAAMNADVEGESVDDESTEDDAS